MVWIVPVLALMLGRATDRRRVLLAVAVAVAFTVRLPYVGDNIPGSWHVALVAGTLMDSYGLLALALLLVLGESRPVPARV